MKKYYKYGKYFSKECQNCYFSIILNNKNEKKLHFKIKTLNKNCNYEFTLKKCNSITKEDLEKYCVKATKEEIAILILKGTI